MLRRTLLIFAVVVPLASPVQAQKWAEKMFETKSHDFGTIARGAKAEYEFVLKNIYVQEVHVASVSVSCGCTTPGIKQALLKTYEQGAILANINSDKFTGPQSSTITVTFDKPAYAKVQLHVKVDIRPDVLVEPEAVQLGEIEQGEGARKTVSVSCTRRSDWRILEVKSANPHLSGEAVETTRGGSRVAYELRVRLDESSPTGYLRDHLMLVTNDELARQIPVMVEGRVVSAVTVSPASLFLGTVQPGQKVTKRIVVRGKKPFRITSIEADCDCFEFGTPAEDAVASLHLVAVTFIAGENDGKIAKTIRIKTDLDEAPITLPTYAAVTKD
ncbi:MAG TPA: DUF1573 domain-containing protein [Thermoguttaceae bacterium]|nr:DUF1573 domain-containing protein [Thermoguttaceae bacterium]